MTQVIRLSKMLLHSAPKIIGASKPGVPPVLHTRPTPLQITCSQIVHTHMHTLTHTCTHTQVPQRQSLHRCPSCPAHTSTLYWVTPAPFASPTLSLGTTSNAWTAATFTMLPAWTNGCASRPTAHCESVGLQTQSSQHI
jgi:hypothetical protein